MRLLTREGCHLCQDALEVLRHHRRRFALDIEIVDIDGDPELLREFAHKIPVVFIDGKERFFGRVDPMLLRRLLRASSHG